MIRKNIGWIGVWALVGSSLSGGVISTAFAQQASPVLQDSQNQSAGSDISSDLYFTIQQLQQEIRELRGTVEELQYQVQQSQKQERDRYVDLDRRILELRDQVESGAAVAPAGAGKPEQDAGGGSSAVVATGEVSSLKPATEAETKAYDDAFALIKQRQYDQAVTALHAFIKDYPDSELTPNAYYWLGEVYLVLPKLEQAKQSFIIVVAKYPDHRKTPDAMYKLGVTYHRLGEKEEARRYLEQTVSRFPKSSSASLAKDYMKQL